MPFTTITVNQKILTILLFASLFSYQTGAQTPTNGDYRTKASGNWNSVSTWQVRSAGAWVNAVSLPTNTSNVYIQNGHFVSLTTTGNCRDLHVYTFLNQFDCDGSLNIYGKIRRYTGTAVTSTSDGVFYSSQANGSSSSAVIVGNQNASTGLFFRGTTRNIINAGEWGVPGLINPYIHINMNAGNSAIVQSPFYTNFLMVNSGTLNMGTNSIFLPSGPAGNGTITVSAGAMLQTANTGTAFNNCIVTDLTGNPPFNFYLYGTLRLMGATPHLRIENFTQYDGSTIEYGASGAQNFLQLNYPATAQMSNYRNLVLSGSGNKTPSANFSVKEDININSSAVLVMSSRTATITGNWSSYGAAGLNEGTSTFIFDSSGAQSINTAGGENFYILTKSNIGTLTLNSNVGIIAGGQLNLSSGTINAGANAFTGTATSALNMSGGTLRLARLNVTLPEFTNPTYNITGGTIVLDGAGNQTLRGARNYRNLTFSVSGTKGITSAINNISGTITVANAVVLDVANNQMGGTGTNLTMSGTSVYKTAGSSQVKPDAQGTYTLGAGTTIEFTNSLTGLQSIRLLGASTVNYYNLIVSGSSVGTASLSTGIRFQSGGTFTVKSDGCFKHTNTSGFSGTTTTAVSIVNNPAIILETGSTVEYNGTNQTISNQTISSPADAHYQNLKLSNTGIKSAPTGTLSVKGNMEKEGSTEFLHSTGTVIMNGSIPQQYISSYPYIKFYHFINNNTVDLSINSELSIEKDLTVGPFSKLNLNNSGNIILLSDPDKTANINAIPANATVNYSGTGKFTLHRYIATGPNPNHEKSWQFLAIATNGLQTINQSWQDSAIAANESRFSGFGTQITSNISPLPSRFDVYTSNGPSMKTYVSATNEWTGVLNTTSTPIYNPKGYMVFVRGDRTVTTYNAPANPTILRSSGPIHWPVSNPPPSTLVGADKFESIGNPYASAIDFSNDAGVIKSATIQRVFYVWDPKLGGNLGFGGYQTFTKGVGADNNYYVAPGGGSYGSIGSVNNIIQSGQAFFVRSFGGIGSVSFVEAAKVNTSFTPFRPAVTEDRNSKIFVQLHKVSIQDTILIDGIVEEFGQNLNNDLDIMDVFKFNNASESLSILRFQNELTVERRRFPNNGDSITLKLSNLKPQNYLLTFAVNNADNFGIKAYLFDRYMRSMTLIDFNQVTSVPFIVNRELESAQPNRFSLVFKSRFDVSPVAEYSNIPDTKKSIIQISSSTAFNRHKNGDYSLGF